jgi:hypothetical protein
MKRLIWATALILWMSTSLPNATAQEKQKTTEQNSEDIRFSKASLKIQVVFTEYDGDKKLKSLPYSFLVTTHTRDGWPEAKIRVGSRVPVYTGGEHGSMSYMDVGTNIDCRAEVAGESQYRIFLSLERSWVDGDVLVPVEKATASAPQGDPHTTQFREPIIRQYKAELSPILKDGQSIETSLATDPLSGRVVKLEVSVSLVK